MSSSSVIVRSGESSLLELHQFFSQAGVVIARCATKGKKSSIADAIRVYGGIVDGAVGVNGPGNSARQSRFVADVRPEKLDLLLEKLGDAGFGNPATRALVEAAAIRAVTEHYQKRDFSVVSVEHERRGWDLTCTDSDRTVARVEVKGTAGWKPSVLLTRNEYRSAGQDAEWVLAVVTRAATQPAVSIHTAVDVLELATPYVYRLDLNHGQS